MDWTTVTLRGRALVTKPRDIDVRALRRRMRMTQNTFSARFGFSVAALRHWERGDRRPSGPALALLNVISHNPGAVLRALKEPLPPGIRRLGPYRPRARGPKRFD